MTIQNKRIFASILFVLISFLCIAATEEVPTPPAPPPPPGLPIDGGIMAAICLGLFYGTKQILKKK